MSRFSQYNKNETYRDNLNYANLQKERKNNEELQEIERDRIVMERLQIELEQEKKMEKERKNQIRQQQYEDYSNYMRQKYADNPQNRENLNVKLGNEQRFIRKPNYSEQMDNLCLNPTRQKNIYPIEPVQNFSEAGRNFQRGYSHGYNILTGESYPQKEKNGKTPQNMSNKMNRNYIGGYSELKERPVKTEFPKEKEIPNLVKEKDEFSQYQAYMEMKRQKELEEMQYLQQQKKKEEENQNINPQSQIPSQLPQQNLNQIDNSDQMGNNLKDIPPEYREMYMKQKILREQELQSQEQEIPPEYREMYMKQKIQREQELQSQEQEIPPEYKEMYMRQQKEIQNQSQKENINREKNEEKNKFIKQSKEEIPEEYGDIMEQQTTQKHGRSTPDNIKLNNFFNQQSYHNPNQNMNDKKPIIESQNIISKQNINKDDKALKEKNEEEYKKYLLSQQNEQVAEKDKEKEDENMEIYQNMLKERELEKLEKNEREQYQQHLLDQQNQNINKIKEPNMNQMLENQPDLYPYQYEERYGIKENQAPKQEMINELNNRPINSFEDYYKQKDINNNIIVSQKEAMNQNTSENKYENYPSQPQYPPEMKNYYPPQEHGLDEQGFLMYQQQKQMQEIEDRERARQILERQQMERMKQNEYYQEPPSSIPYNATYENQNSEKVREYKNSKMEYLQNKQKNLLNKDNIFSVGEIPKPQPKYSNEPLTNAERLRIQREYAQFLDAQINAKSIKNKARNNGLGSTQSTGYDVGGPNPYQQLRDKHNKLKDIPQDPYSTKNYNISNNSYLTSNPITNPVNSYKFVDRRRLSGRLQNNGSNIIGK